LLAYFRARQLAAILLKCAAVDGGRERLKDGHEKFVEATSAASAARVLGAVNDARQCGMGP
jgi:hypothetical protein